LGFGGAVETEVLPMAFWVHGGADRGVDRYFPSSFPVFLVVRLGEWVVLSCALSGEERTEERRKRERAQRCEQAVWTNFAAVISSLVIRVLRLISSEDPMDRRAALERKKERHACIAA
jgi:hypothetical protein